MLCPPFFLIVIGEVKIRTTNPSLFTSVRRLDLAAIATFNVFGIAYTNQIFDRIMVYKRLSTMTPFESVRYIGLFADCSHSSFSMPYNSMSSQVFQFLNTFPACTFQSHSEFLHDSSPNSELISSSLYHQIPYPPGFFPIFNLFLRNRTNHLHNRKKDRLGLF